MKLATILTSVLLVLALGVVGCDSGDGGGGSGEDIIMGSEETSEPDDDGGGGDPTCDATCVGKCGKVDKCDCGGCDAGFTCVEATNLCAQDVDCNTVCGGKECGTFEGCNCGECGADLTCNTTTGVCEQGGCVADCTGKQCGPDSCGGSCGLCPCVGCDPSATVCNDVSGMCEGAAELTCAGINECAGACAPNDTACQQECMNNGSAEAQQQLNLLLQCFSDNGGQGCAPGDNQCVNDIIEEFCMDEYGACFPSGDKTCSELSDCIQTCQQGDQACVDQCASEATFDAISQYNAMVACVIEQCGEQPTEDCWNAAQQGACAAVFSDCFNLGKPGFASGPNGAASSDYVNMKMFLMGLDKDKLYN